MPIRDMDMFASKENKNIYIAANRGTSGIDGNIASALGFSYGLEKKLTILIGDLAFIHDLNSLTLLKDANQPVTIVLVNNSGGGIFSFLPISGYKEVFEPAFATPHDYSFEQTSKQFGLKYFKPETRSEFREIYSHVTKQKNHSLIEVCTNRDENFLLHKNLLSKIKTLGF